MQIASYSTNKRGNHLKSAIRKHSKEFSFIKIQLKKISSLNGLYENPKAWIDNSLEKLEIFCTKILEGQVNADRRSIVKLVEAVLSIYISDKVENKERQRKIFRRKSERAFASLNSRQQEIALYVKNISSTRGPDPFLNSVCELLHLCRWGTKNVPVNSSERMATKNSSKSNLQKKEILFLLAKLLKDLGVGKRKSIDTLTFSINRAYGNWNAYSVGAFPRAAKPIFSSKVGWSPNS